MRKHFEIFAELYNFIEIQRTYKVLLELDKLNEDCALSGEWPDLLSDLKLKPTETLAIIGLAIHSLIVGAQNEITRRYYQYQKIYVRRVDVVCCNSVHVP